LLVLRFKKKVRKITLFFANSKIQKFKNSKIQKFKNLIFLNPQAQKELNGISTLKCMKNINKNFK